MCGRYNEKLTDHDLVSLFDLEQAEPWSPRYNIAPRQPAPVILAEANGRRRMRLLRWGLIPGWAKEAAVGDRLINARADGLAAKPSFRSAFKRRRCLVPATGFYEWKPAGTVKQPFHICREDGGGFAFAGLWESWTDPASGGQMETFTIITTEPNALLAPIHSRMPVILPEADYPIWLDPGVQDAAQLEGLLRPAPEKGWTAYPIGRAVNRPTVDSPSLIQPAENESGSDATP